VGLGTGCASGTLATLYCSASDSLYPASEAGARGSGFVHVGWWCLAISVPGAFAWFARFPTSLLSVHTVAFLSLQSPSRPRQVGLSTGLETEVVSGEVVLLLWGALRTVCTSLIRSWAQILVGNLGP
jgi:hypothetical protein